jgi:tetratricopeptide (TPR) repeat protein
MCPAAARIAVLASASLAVGAHAAGVSESATSATVLGPSNELLAEGARALEEGRTEEGVRLTSEGLRRPNHPQDEAAGHSNLCAGYVMLRRWDEALEHCNRSLEIDDDNWRTYNNRAAVYVGKGLFDLAIADVESGLAIAPESSTLKRSLRIVHEHKRVHTEKRRTTVKA